MQVLSIDIETYSSFDLRQCGVHRYVETEDFEILLFAYAVDDAPIQIVDLAQGELIPAPILEALTNPNVIKTAFNAAFERTCIAKFFDLPMPPEQWRCTQAHALMLGLPRSLKEVASVFYLEKDPRGQSLIRYFSIPCKPTKANGGRTRNHPHHDLSKWESFKEYCKQDVAVERDIRRKLERYPMPENEQSLWVIDQRINDQGIRLDRKLVESAIQFDAQTQDRLEDEAKRLTGLENPNSLIQLKQWLKDQKVNIDHLTKKNVPEWIEKTDGTVQRMLQIRQALSKTSIKKYQAMNRVMGIDDRARGLFQFYGANRTGRWAGRLIQVQNLPRNKISDLNLARELLLEDAYEDIELLYGSPSEVLSQLVRTAFVASPGNRLLVSDFSAIEARVIAWLAGEQWRLDVFKTHGKIYEASASQMFRVPIESITKGSELRQKGKVAELALGYQGSVGALKQMGALEMGLSEEELFELVSRWRKANLRIVQFWRDVENAALRAIKEVTTVSLPKGLAFQYEPGMLFLRLPSGRRLAYVRPCVDKDDQLNKDFLTYKIGSQREKTYGGKLVENIVQAVARDCLAESMLRLDQAGYNMVMHVHDEIVADQAHGSIKEMSAIMSEPIPWAPGLPLAAEGFMSAYYKKE
ncbi:DNA polymerase [Seinonella peptonophila]|uniref:DNA-directed DNA polymerase n=1 Tax=Seinonella peptonophila TaxID=112248 RepID=A0A1M5A0J9_9BACL|nr:DNA polymerase [Seinonella peptonophila]SHF23741.1 DNA polymerase [Seinonella peptonophila]